MEAGRADFVQRQQKKIDEINALGDCFDQYSYLLYRAGQMPPMDAAYKTDAYRVKGCQSVVWLDLKVCDGVMVMQADSETLLMKGVLAVLADVVNGASPQEICANAITIFDETELAVTFESDRLSGLRSILRRIRQAAQEAAGSGVPAKPDA